MFTIFVMATLTIINDTLLPYALISSRMEVNNIEYKLPLTDLSKIEMKNLKQASLLHISPKIKCTIEN